MDKITLKEEVIKLREQGKTYLEIQKILKTHIPKSTLSYWCSNFPLPLDFQRRIRDYNKLNLNKARTIALDVIKAKRERYLNGLEERNLHLLKKLDKDVLKIALSMLYFGEGAKWKSHAGLCLGSSDSNLIRLYLKLLKSCYNINTNRLRCRISYRADQNINELQEFWSKITKIPLPNFYKTKPDPRTIGKRTRKKGYKGVCVIWCTKATEIQLELEIITKLILSFRGPIAQLAER